MERIKKFSNIQKYQISLVHVQRLSICYRDYRGAAQFYYTLRRATEAAGTYYKLQLTQVSIFVDYIKALTNCTGYSFLDRTDNAMIYWYSWHNSLYETQSIYGREMTLGINWMVSKCTLFLLSTIWYVLHQNNSNASARTIVPYQQNVHSRVPTAAI
jgi:hypothetical protein